MAGSLRDLIIEVKPKRGFHGNGQSTTSRCQGNREKRKPQCQRSRRVIFYKRWGGSNQSAQNLQVELVHAIGVGVVA